MKFFRQFAIMGLIAALSSVAIAEVKKPEVITYLEQQGIEIVNSFESEAGLTGYAAIINGRAVSIYLTPDKKYAMIGNLIDANGNDLGIAALKQFVISPSADKAWLQLDNANWVADGSNTAKRVIYTFTDPNCPYCHKLRKAAEAEIAAGNVQLRHIMVGVISQKSPSQAANILGANDPEAALKLHHTNLAKGGIEQKPLAIKKGAGPVSENTQLMQALGYSGTPVSFYKDENGELVVLQGLPRADAMKKMLNK
jgi:thiol:disulfide interchange protein DsbG